MEERDIGMDFKKTAVAIGDGGASSSNDMRDEIPLSDGNDGKKFIGVATPFETLREHDRKLYDEFASGWSSGTQNLSLPPSVGDDDFSRLLHEPMREISRKGWDKTARFLLNSWACLGIVYGDIGTSPIYTISSILSFTTSPSEADVKGAVSLIIWSLLLIVVFKYLILVLETDYHGKGGVFALISVLFPVTKNAHARELLVLLACFAFACMIADGALTPAVSVVSAVAGILIPVPSLGNAFVVPISMLILVLLLFYQRWGTAIIGYSFSPIILLWFISLAGFGISWIIQAPDIFEAFNPWLAIDFVIRNQVTNGWLNLANVLLAVTGCEALYADRGHFGANPIRFSWFCCAFPALLLNYLGQGALLLVDPSKVGASYFNMLQGPLYWPVFILTIFATIIASQAMLSGMFSLVQQALALDVCPRVKLVQTNEREEGQVYAPAFNVVLGLLCLGIIAGFQTSSALTNTYGFNISMIMFQTSVLFCFVLRLVWKWWIPTIIIVMGPIMFLELGFLTAAFSKIPNGAWFTATVAAIFTVFFYVWHRGRISMNTVAVEAYMDTEDWASRDRIPRVVGRSFFFTPLPIGIPPLVATYAEHINALPSEIVLISMRKVRIPRVPDSQIYLIEPMVTGMWRVIVTMGFRQVLDFSKVMADLDARGLHLHGDHTSYVFSIPHVEAKEGSPWYHRLMLWAFRPMEALQYSLALEYGVPSGQTIQIGHSLKC